MSGTQLRAAGLTPGQVSHRVRRGVLHRVHRGVYAVGHDLLTREGKLQAGALACGRGAATSRQTGADLLGLRPSSDPRIHLTVPSAHARVVPGLIVHRSPTLGEDEVTTHAGIPVTTVARTLLDLSAVLPGRQVERAIERAEALRIFDLRAVEAVLRVHPRHQGAGALRNLLAAWEEPALTRSELEKLFLELCRNAELPWPQVNVRVGPYEVDFLWPERGVVVETDSHTHHGTRAAFERDRLRDAWLEARGYRVVRFTYRQVLRGRRLVEEVLRSLLGGA